jgi:uncharacterized membrane protein YcaP (DUF421 family)
MHHHVKGGISNMNDVNNSKQERMKMGAFLIAAVIVILDICVIALGTIMDEVPVTLTIGCVGVITFIGTLVFTNYLSGDAELAKKELRKAITAAFTLVYLVFLGLVVFGDTFGEETELAKTVVGHFTWIVGIIITFYFGSRIVESMRQNKP